MEKPYSEKTAKSIYLIPPLWSLQALKAGRTIAFVHDYNGNVKVVGIDSGLDATTSTAQTGGAGGDLSGYNITLQAMDSKEAPFLSSSAKTALEALVSDVVIEP